MFVALRRVETTVNYAPGAEDNLLAAWLGELIAGNSKNPRGRRALDRLRAAVSVVAPDRRQAATLRFDHGLVTVHDGIVEIPDMTLCGDYDVLVRALQLPLRTLGPLALPGFRGRGAWARSSAGLLSGELKIYGLLTHMRLCWRVIRALAPQS